MPFSLVKNTYAITHKPDIIYPNKFHIVTESETKEVTIDGIYYVVKDTITDKVKSILYDLIGDVYKKEMFEPSGFDTVFDVINHPLHKKDNKLTKDLIDSITLSSQNKYYYYNNGFNFITYINSQELCLWGNKVKWISDFKIFKYLKTIPDVILLLNVFKAHLYAYNDADLEARKMFDYLIKMRLRSSWGYQNLDNSWCVYNDDTSWKEFIDIVCSNNNVLFRSLTAIFINDTSDDVSEDFWEPKEDWDKLSSMKKEFLGISYPYEGTPEPKIAHKLRKIIGYNERMRSLDIDILKDAQSLIKPSIEGLKNCDEAKAIIFKVKQKDAEELKEVYDDNFNVDPLVGNILDKLFVKKPKVKKTHTNRLHFPLLFHNELHTAEFTLQDKIFFAKDVVNDFNVKWRKTIKEVLGFTEEDNNIFTEVALADYSLGKKDKNDVKQKDIIDNGS
jgi:hypothetical protein